MRAFHCTRMQDQSRDNDRTIATPLAGIPGSRFIIMPDSTRPQTPECRRRLAKSIATVLPAGWSNPSAKLDTFLGAQCLHGRSYPIHLDLACFRAYASRTSLPRYAQGSIPDSWLAAIGGDIYSSLMKRPFRAALTTRLELTKVVHRSFRRYM